MLLNWRIRDLYRHEIRDTDLLSVTNTDHGNAEIFLDKQIRFEEVPVEFVMDFQAWSKNCISRTDDALVF